VAKPRTSRPAAATLLNRFKHLWKERNPEAIPEIRSSARMSEPGTATRLPSSTGSTAFRIRGKLADEVYVVFDTAPTRDALARRAEAAGVTD
jgi:hypothetical protein